MRFDDMLATVLARPIDSDAGRVAAWRQIVDLLAQRRGSDGDMLSTRAYALLAELRFEVPGEVRAEVAHAIAGRRIPRRLIAYFAEEPIALAAPMLRRARLDAADWIALLPGLSPSARAILRHRRDLGDDVAAALASFGATDFVLSAPAVESSVAATEPVPVEDPVTSAAMSGEASSPANAPSVQRGEAQIRELVARIEAFRKCGARPVETRPPVAAIAADSAEWPRLEDFRWETGADGVMLWVEGAPRGALIGQSIAFAASGGDGGVDAQAGGAFGRRAPFRDARLRVAGVGPAAGDWRISGVPFFDTIDDSFAGYRGTARRPRIDESAAPVEAEGPTGLYGTGLSPDSLRQLVHELRTPLNAILGFAEMIDRQMLGPAAAPYRRRAAEITGQAARLLAAVDDLDTAARIETSRLTLDNRPLAPDAILARMEADYAALAAGRGATLALAIAPELPVLDGDSAAVERMFARLLASTIGMAGEGETVAARLDLDPRDAALLRFSLTQPIALAGRDETALLDPGFAVDGDWPDAPALGLGFSLRLVRHLSRAAGGSLDVDDGAFVLRLPLERGVAVAGEAGA